MEMNDETFKEDLRESRLKVGLSYLNAEFIDTLVEQLSKVVVVVDNTESLIYIFAFRFVQVRNGMHDEQQSNLFKIWFFVIYSMFVLMHNNYVNLSFKDYLMNNMKYE
jgi:sRNA-binding regulator protein Hfq